MDNELGRSDTGYPDRLNRSTDHPSEMPPPDNEPLLTSLRGYLKRPVLLLVIACLCIILSYSNVIHGEFQFDDGYIVSDEGEFLKDPFKMLNGGLFNLLKTGTRLLPAFTFYFNYLIGGPKVEPFHITNILLHILMVTVVYLFVKKVLSEEKLRYSLPYRREYLATSVAGLWGAHPLLTQAVSYISQRSEVMSSLFYLIGLMVFVRAAETKGRKSLFYWLIGLMVFLFGWLSKVIVVTLPAAVVLYILYFKDRAHLKKAFFMVLPVLVVGAVFGLKMVLGFKETTNVGFKLKEIGQPEYFFTELRVLVTYIRLIFLPLGQSIDHDYPIYRSFSDINVIGSALFHAIMIGVSLYTLKMKTTIYRTAGFGVLWFYLLLLPTSSVVPIKDVIFEHRVYLASMGIVLSVVIILAIGLKGLRWMPALAVATVMVLCFVTFQRNFVWQSRLALWQDAVRKAPNKSRPHNNLGICYYNLAIDDKAYYHFKRAIELDPENLEAYYNMGLVLEAMGRKSEAVYYYMMFIQKSRGRYPELLNQLKKKFFSGKYGIP